MRREEVGVTVGLLYLKSLRPLSEAVCGRLQLGVAYWVISIPLLMYLIIDHTIYLYPRCQPFFLAFAAYLKGV